MGDPVRSCGPWAWARAPQGARSVLGDGVGAALCAPLAAAAVAFGAFGVAAALAAPGPPAAAPAQDDDEPEVTVVGKKLPKLPGAVVGDIKPELMLSPADIQSYGVSTVTELLDELAPETRSDRGRGSSGPVVLLNGRRISSFAEIQNIPTEAILRVDVLPEEVSLKYGYTADQRVVNIVLRRRFRALTLEGQGGSATEGGVASGKGEADLLHIRGDARINLDLKIQSTDALTEAERGIVTPTAPFSVLGSVYSATPGSQIDPALSQLAGLPVLSLLLPRIAPGAAPTLQQLLAGANSLAVGDQSADRTLLSSSDQISGNAVFARPLAYGIQGALNVTLGATKGQSLQGLQGLSILVAPANPFSPFASPVVIDRLIDHPLRQTTEGWTAHLGTTLNKDVGPFRLSLTDAFDHAQSTVATDAGFDGAAYQNAVSASNPGADPFAAFPALPALPENRAQSVTDQANIQVLANGPVIKEPAGQIYVSGKIGDTWSALSSQSLRQGVTQTAYLSRNDASVQLSVDVPLAGGDRKILAPVGDLSVNLNGALDDLSDFGLLTTLGAGLNWTPIEGVNLIVSTTHDHAAPTPAQLAGPLLATPGVRLYDFLGGQTVSVLQLTGGAPGLLADTRQVYKIGLTWKPIKAQDLTVTANYIASRIRNAVSSLPTATAALELALPDRFIRDPDGELIEEDDRPLNLLSQSRQEIRWGFNYARPLGPQPPPRPERRGLDRRRDDGIVPGAAPSPGGAPVARAGDAPPGPARGEGVDVPVAGRGAGEFRGRSGSGQGPGRGAAGGRLQAAIYHTVFFEDQALLRSGGPLLDYLNGAPVGSAGGQARQEVQAQLGATLAGFGGRLSADWKSGTVIRGGSAGDLSFSDLATINVRLFENFGQQRWATSKFAWLSGARLTLSALNLFDSRMSVRSSLGATPLVYLGPFLDPAGRTVSLSIRKLFY